MKTVTINLYSFNELSKENKQKAISNLSDINTDYSWWECVYEDAKNIGLTLENFDMDCASIITDLSGNFTLSAHEIAANIIRDHGEDCETNKTAQTFLNEVNSVEGDGEGAQYEEEMMQIEETFLCDLLIDYKNMLQKEYEYKCSDAAITETIEANAYFFFEDGTLAHCTTYTGKHEKAGITEFHFHGRDYVIETENQYV